MNRIEEIVAKALKNVNGDRYKLSLLVSKRVMQLSAGDLVLAEGIDTSKMKFADIALVEIAQNKVVFDGITKADQ